MNITICPRIYMPLHVVSLVGWGPTHTDILMLVETRGQCWVFLYHSPALSFQTASLNYTEAHCFRKTKLAGHQAPGILLSLISRAWITGTHHHAWHFTWVFRVQTQALVLMQQRSYQLGCPPPLILLPY